MKKIFIILATALLTLASCEKSFDVKYTSQLTGSNAAAMVENDPTFLDSYVQGLYGAMVEYGAGGSTNHDDYGIMSVFTNTEYMGGDIVLSGTQNWGLYDYMFDYRAFNYSRPYQLWSTFYTLIANANIIIAFFPADQEPTNEVAKAALGQAYAVRAFAYIYEMLYFQDPCNAAGDFNADAPGVPVIFANRDGKTQDEMDTAKGRNTMGFVAAEAEKDINNALKYLEGYVRPSKNMIDWQVAQGIAARLYLFTHQWEKAANAANAARQGYKLMDKARLYAGMMDVEDAEVLWGFNHTTETQTTYASFFSHMSNYSPGYSGIGQMIKCIDKDLYDQIPATDFRKGLFNTEAGNPNASQEGGKHPYASMKFGYDSQWCQDYLYMRAAEMYLIRAEALARTGANADAAAAMKPLMQKRDLGYTKNSVTVEDVLLQRRIELWGEGFSYFDHRRWQMDMDRGYEGTNEPSTTWPAHFEKGFVPWWHFSWRYQLPLKEIQENIYQKALNYRNEHTTKVDTYEEFKEKIEEGGFILAHWDGTPETEERIKEETKATIRCLPLEADEESLQPGVDMVTGKPSARRVLFARAY